MKGFAAVFRGVRLPALLGALWGLLWLPLLQAAERADGAADTAPVQALEEASQPGNEERLDTDQQPDIEQKSEDRPDLPSLAEVLGAEDDAEIEALSERCLTMRRIRSHRVLDQQHIVFVMNTREQYLVRFPRRCIGLRRGDPISMESTAGRLCRLDSIRPLQRNPMGFDPGVRCMVPGFQRVTPEQVDYLVEALKRRRSR